MWLKDIVGGLVKWIIKHECKKRITNAFLKDLIHDKNCKFAKRVRIEGKEHVAAIANDVMECVSMRLNGFSDDGKITDEELVKINETDDHVIDKYFTDEKISKLIDYMFSLKGMK